MQDWWQKTFPKGRQTLVILDANDRPVSLAYGEKGFGQPIVFVHGIASWSYCWHNTVEALAEHYRVICFDAKGSGFSEKPLQPEPPNHKVIELIRVVRSLTEQPIVLVAESLGALVALAAVQAEPALCDRLVLINAPTFIKQLPNWGMRLLAELPIDWVRWVDHLGLTRHLAPLVRQIIYTLREEVVANINHVQPDDIYWLTYPHLTFPHTLTKLAAEFQLCAQEIRLQAQGKPNLIRSIQANLKQITCPTLVLSAEHDRWFPVSDGEKLCDRLPNAQFQIIPNCGHYAAGAQPEFVNAAILTFLSQTNVKSVLE
jgi:pimeloyl-ACP methyl ester carboxylesterase